MDLVIPNLNAQQIESLRSQLCQSGPTGPTGPTAPTGPTGPTQPPGTIGLTLTFDGVVRDTNGMNTSHSRAVGSFVGVADYAGKISMVQVFEHGSASIWRKGYLTQDPNVLPTGFQQGSAFNLMISWDKAKPGYTNVRPGERWYVVVDNVKMDGTPSCSSGLNCNFGYAGTLPTTAG